MGHSMRSPPMAQVAQMTQSPTPTAITMPMKAQSRPEPHTAETLATPLSLSTYPYTPPFSSGHQILPLHITDNQPSKPPAGCEKGQPVLGKASGRHVSPSNTLSSNPSSTRYVQDLSDVEDEEEDDCEVDRQKEHAAFILVRSLTIPPFPPFSALTITRVTDPASTGLSLHLSPAARHHDHHLRHLHLCRPPRNLTIVHFQ